ncbi:MAG: hypothetical protein WKF97_11945 [Chitinophagaceae bacterium]
MRWLINSCLSVMVCSLFVACSSKAVTETIAYQNKEQVWKNFRNTFNYHLQIIGATKVNEDESLTIIISEPPPHVIREELEKVVEDYKFVIEEQKNIIGYDGWTKDLVITISGIESDEKELLVKDLNNYVYHTEYKAFAVNLPIENNTPQYLNNLNYQIQVSELDKWIIEDAPTFFSDKDTTADHTLKDFFASNTKGILYSRKPGFVVWLISEGEDITDQEEDIRKFTLDSDLILGAIKDNSGPVAIIARERINTVLELPPLRTETIKLLAAADDQEISQSYERMNLFAGKMSNGKDWAPIYLSKDLINTEYGSLLNITDQMLKSWSLNGGVEYEGFGYPKPSYFAFAAGVMEEMNTMEITFNWNTKGAGYTVEKDGMEFYALNRSGALPVTYIPAGMKVANKQLISRCEQKAYSYFANLNNPDLVRVVQYASLYQIFSRYNISSYKSDSSTPDVANPLKSHAVDLLYSIETLDEGAKEEVVVKFIRQALSAEGVNEEKINGIIKSLKDDDLRNLFKSIDKLQRIITTSSTLFSANYYDEFADAIVNPRDQTISSYTDRYKIVLASEFRKDVKYWWPLILRGTTEDSLKNEYVRAYHEASAAWIKTPSIVISWFAKDSASFTGRHNLCRKIFLMSMPSQKSGFPC